MGENTFSLSSDKPVTNPDNDVLGYAGFSKNIAESLIQGEFNDGIVLSIYGEWGAGKSTVLKFIEHYIELSSSEIEIIHFNPWWYSGEEALLKSFFAQLNSVFSSWKSEGKNLAEKISIITEVLAKTPIVEAKAADALLKKLLGTNLNSLKSEIEVLLRKEKKKIVVVIDDIDRLTGDEVKQLFKLIKAVANFPYVAYVLAFDRNVVAKSIEEALKVNGEDYIEKIIQVPFDLPSAEGEMLAELFFEKINKIYANIPEENHDNTYFGNLYHDGIKYFFQTPRDIIRLTNTIGITFPSVFGEVNHIDFLAIECIRVFEPKVYAELRNNPSLFCGTNSSSAYGKDDSQEKKREIEVILGYSEKISVDVMQSLLTRLFPKVESILGNMHYGNDFIPLWRKNKRICCEEIFNTYFRFSIKKGSVSILEIEGTVALFNEREQLIGRLREFANEMLPNKKSKLSVVLPRVCDYLDDLEESKIKIIVSVLFDIGDEFLLPSDEQQAMFDDWGNDVKMGRILFQILPKIESDTRYELLKESFEKGMAIHFMFREAMIFGQQHGKYSSESSRSDSDCIVTLDQQEQLEKICLDKIRTHSESGDLLLKSNILGTLYRWRDWGHETEPSIWIKTIIEKDLMSILNVLSLFESKSFSHGSSDMVAKSHSRVNVKNISDFLELEYVKEKVEQVLSCLENDSTHQALCASFFKELKLFEENPATYNEA